MSIFGWSYPPGVSSLPWDDTGAEVCPVCGKDNWDDEKEVFIHSSEVYCSDDCEEKDFQRMKAEAEAEARYLEEEEKMEEEIRAYMERIKRDSLDG